MSFQLYVIDNTLNNTFETTLRREKKNQIFEYFVFVMNKQIKKRKKRIEKCIQSFTK